MWDIKFRPKRFSEVLGQEGAVRVLKARLAAGTALSTSYLFAGGFGTGKTTLARILARALLCQDLQPDSEPCNKCDNCEGILTETSAAFSEMDAASKGKIDNIRAIVDDLPFVVSGAPVRVYLFDESHALSKEGQDVLLKPLEDKKMVGIFCTTEPEKMRGAIKSRCESHTIRRITREEILLRMKWVVEQEGVQAEDDALLIVIDQSGGHVRDILNCLEMVAQMGPISVSSVREYLKSSVVSVYYEVLLSLGDPAKAVLLAEQASDQVGVDNVFAGLAEAAMNSFRLANGMFADFTFVDRERAQKVYELYKGQTTQLARFFLEAQSPTKVGLVCALLACTGGAPSMSSTTVVATAPVVVVSAPRVASEATLATPSVPLATTVREALTAPVVPPSAPLQHLKLCPTSEKGNLGSGDVQALTAIDQEAISPGFPRGSKPSVAPPTVIRSETKDKSQLIPPAQFKREFMNAWLHSHKGGE